MSVRSGEPLLRSERTRISPEIHRVLAALGAKPCGTGWVACCPAHEDTRPSLSIGIGNNGALLLHCFRGCAFSEIMRAIDCVTLVQSRVTALFPNAANGCVTVPVRKGGGSTGIHTPEAARNSSAALSIWHESRAANGCLVERYLRKRGVTIAPPSLRFHPNLRHPSGRYLPAMVAAVSNVADTITAIHRTYLLPRLRTDKLMLGPVSGGAVRLAPVAAKIAIAEGIETALSVMQIAQLPAWAALSTSGVIAVVLPDEVREVVICADGDDPGRQAARTLAARLKREGRVVRIAEAPTGHDYNDHLRGRDD